MNPRNRVWIWVLGLVAVAGAYLGMTYNRLVKQEENVKLNWGNLQNAYQRRLDLTPNLVAAVKASSDYEKQTLQQVTEARAKAMEIASGVSSPTPDNYQRQEQVQGEMVKSINRVIAVMERYPDIKSAKNFLLLQSQLEGTERRIKVSRSDFNAAVASYNKLVRGFPSGIAASVFGFKTKEGFLSEAGADTAPEVKF